MRILKNPEIRRQEIIEAAQALFEKEGYTKTSVEAIIQASGIAKGTFYYYFKSKQAVLQAIVENITLELKTYFEEIVHAKKLSTLEKIKEIFVGSKKQQTIRPDIMEIIHLPENRELQERLNIEAVNLIAPLITKVFDQGYQEGIFKQKPSLESIQILLAGIQFVLGSGLFEWSNEKTKKFEIQAQILLESVAGAKKGMFDFIKLKT